MFCQMIPIDSYLTLKILNSIEGFHFYQADYFPKAS